MLSKAPAKRPSTQEIMQHPWLTNNPTIPDAQPNASHPPPPGPFQLQSQSPPDRHMPSQLHLHPNPHPHRASTGDPSTPIESRLTDLTATSLCCPGHGLNNVLDGAAPYWRHPSLTVQPPSVCNGSTAMMSNSAPDGEIGNLDDLVLLVMESLGMKRSQILESLERRAYDHLMATYLLLGEKLRRHRHNLPFSSSVKSNLCPPQTVCELDTLSPVNRPPVGVDVGRAKYSRMDRSVDVRCPLSETEFVSASVLSASVPNTERREDEADESYRERKWPAAEYRSNQPGSRFTTPWSQNPDFTTTLPSTLPTADTLLSGPRFQSYTDSSHPASYLRPPQLTETRMEDGEDAEGETGIRSGPSQHTNTHHSSSACLSLSAVSDLPVTTAIATNPLDSRLCTLNLPGQILSPDPQNVVSLPIPSTNAHNPLLSDSGAQQHRIQRLSASYAGPKIARPIGFIYRSTEWLSRNKGPGSCPANPSEKLHLVYSRKS
ncbi:unnamed protein product [Echinostoma caproni]|uniref:non-specific serine/threonine protein kinase n=1 Tax=Echinostoma caproni TaxID=27848 RepID=A0A183AJR7_9TREM|nr:unnamed protein product [Echinostoma caproni]